MKKRKQYLKLIILYIIPFISWYGYNYIGFNITIFKAIYFAILPILAIYIFREFKGTSFIKSYFRKLTILISFSIIMSWLVWEQPITLGYRSTAPILSIIFIFLLYKNQYSESELRQFIEIQFIIYSLLFLYALYKAPEVVFGLDNEKELSDSRGIFRITIANSGFLILAFFMFLNNWVVEKSKKYIILAIFAFILIIMTTVRQVILWSFIVSIFYLFRKWKYMWGILAISIITINFTTVKINEDSVIGSLIELTENQVNDNQQGDTYIRFLEYKYYFTNYSDNLLAFIFGNGQAHSESAFGKYEEKLNNYYGFYQSDVGYARFFVQWGILGLILVILLLHYPLKYKMPENLIFLKLYVIYQIFANIAASWFWHEIITICVTYYMIDCFALSKNNKLNKK